MLRERLSPIDTVTDTVATIAIAIAISCTHDDISSTRNKKKNLSSRVESNRIESIEFEVQLRPLFLSQ